MKIALEVGWSHKPGGARRVAFNLLAAMQELRPDHEYFLLSNQFHSGSYGSSLTQVVLPAPHSFSQVVWDQLLFPHVAVPLSLRRIRPDVVLYTNNIIPFWGFGKACVIIHDMTPFIIPDSFRPVHGWYQRFYFRYATRNAERIITVSENSREDIVRYLGVDREKISVIPLAASLPKPSSNSAAHLTMLGETPFILYVGAIHPRKNVGRIIEAFALLAEQGYEEHMLVIAGEARWMTDDLLKSEAFSRMRNRIRFAGRVDDEQLVALYRRCSAFVYPSLYEGFGLPVLEAMACGAPVVTSNRSSLPEVAGDAALLVDPYNVTAIAGAIKSLIDDPLLADRYRQLGRERSCRFSWERSAKKVLDILETFE